MKIGIIGAGFTGLSAAYYLLEKGHEVTIIEKESQAGGLAIGFKEKNWKWTLEKHYHHLFVSDNAIRNLAQKVGHKIIFKRPKTSTYINNSIMQLDSPLSLLRFSHLSISDRIRTGLVLAYLRSTPFWKPLEKISAERFLRKFGGENSWKILWKPLFLGKFGRYSDQIPAVWFWARIKKRSASLGYPEGGFQSLSDSIAEYILKKGGKFNFEASVKQIEKIANQIIVTTEAGTKFEFDKVVCTLPTSFFTRVTKGLPPQYTKKLINLNGLGAINLVLSLNRKFLNDNSYWLNINQDGCPFLAVVEHTNFIDKKNYNGDRLVYIGNYLDPQHKYFQITEEQLLAEYLPALKKINPAFKKNWITQIWMTKANFAQPIIPLNYSKKIPPFKTPINGLYLANIQQVYPWDRGTNYAVELGQKIAGLILNT
ncbi:MAG: NAD(P)/FAD-dependent oxidoreductase [Candidatus Daviesbacteria bacterium]|nr:NAD(P)/FAD-dependent oxidoreductase [Candidatus Daviesbacteria bacterium]